MIAIGGIRGIFFYSKPLSFYYLAGGILNSLKPTLASRFFESQQLVLQPLPSNSLLPSRTTTPQKPYRLIPPPVAKSCTQ